MGQRRDENACIWDFWALRVDCRACDAGAATPFAVIGPQVLGSLPLRVENFIPPQGVLVVRAGEPADALFTVRKGFLKLWTTDDEGHQRVLRLLKPGDMFGLEALLEPRYRLNAETLTPAGLCRIPLDVVSDLLKREPLLCAELERRWMHQLQRTDEFITNIASGPSRGRVVKLLRCLAQIAHPEPAPYVSRMDMASMLDISRETAARVIADLKRQGLLEETRSHLLFDPQNLPD
jgi:CRP/FNR family transcriptional regulator, anaerobic regulatory protein